ncbi:MAG: methyltransferase domain-containing protein [bacterium]
MTDSFLLLFAILGVSGTVLWGGWTLWFSFKNNGAPFVPTSRRDVEDMLRLANIQPNDRVVDLGSGDGRLIFAAAKSDAAQAVGYEISLFWYWVSQQKRKKTPFSDKMCFYRQSFWNADLRSFNVVFVYQCRRKKVMQSLADKLKRELAKGSRIICCIYGFPDWKPVAKAGKNLLYVIE